MSNLIYIDLFAGCGGLSLGLYNAGWKGLFAIEKNKDAFLTFKHNLIDKLNHFNWPKWLPIQNHDINETLDSYNYYLHSLAGKVCLAVGGPPCQGFSSAGRRNEKDDRNNLVNSYIEFIRIVRPKNIFLENVQGFTFGFKNSSGRGRPFSAVVEDKLKELGYKTNGQIIDFAEYGIPQRRKRFILIGSLEFDPKDFFEKLKANRDCFLKEKGIKIGTTLGDAISDLLHSNGVVDCPDSQRFKSGLYSTPYSKYQILMRTGKRCTGKVPDSHRYANHSKEIIELFEKIICSAEKNKRLNRETGKKYGLKKRGVFLLDANSVAPTLTTHPDDYIHYKEPRILTVREYARIQSFPDWFEFKGKYTTGGPVRVIQTPRYTQLGNAIPPLFGEQVGLVLKKMVHADDCE